MLQSEISERVRAGEKLWAILIDPDKLPYDEITDFMLMANQSSCDYILVGGSLINHNQFQSYLKKIHEISTKKVIIFPGNSHQISNHADALLLFVIALSVSAVTATTRFPSSRVILENPFFSRTSTTSLSRTSAPAVPRNRKPSRLRIPSLFRS